MRVGVAALCRREHACDAGVVDKVMADLGRRRGVAAADAGRAHHANTGTRGVLQFMQQLFRAQHGAGQRIADPNGQRRDIRLALLHHVEMGVEGRGFEHFRERELHLVGERCEMGGGNLVIFVLDQMQMLDQEIAPPRLVAEQEFNLVRSGRIDLASLGSRLRAPSSLAGMFERANLLNVMAHRSVSFLPWRSAASFRSAILIGGMPDAKRNYVAAGSI